MAPALPGVTGQGRRTRRCERTQPSSASSSGTGGVPNTGDTTGAGGVAGSSLSSAGTGCAGPLEAFDPARRLCIAREVALSGPTIESGATEGDPPLPTDFVIGATEITRGQYADWLATSPPPFDVSDADCGWKSPSGHPPDAACMNATVACEPDCSQHPVVCVDWCSARAYREGIGRSLCGKQGGGLYRYDLARDATVSQWYWACTSGNLFAAPSFPYGPTYQPLTCVGRDHADAVSDGTAPVGSHPLCQSVAGYEGVLLNFLGCSSGGAHREAKDERLGFRCCGQ